MNVKGFYTKNGKVRPVTSRVSLRRRSRNVSNDLSDADTKEEFLEALGNLDLDRWYDNLEDHEFLEWLGKAGYDDTSAILADNPFIRDEIEYDKDAMDNFKEWLDDRHDKPSDEEIEEAVEDGKIDNADQWLDMLDDRQALLDRFIAENYEPDQLLDVKLSHHGYSRNRPEMHTVDDILRSGYRENIITEYLTEQAEYADNFDISPTEFENTLMINNARDRYMTNDWPHYKNEVLGKLESWKNQQPIMPKDSQAKMTEWTPDRPPPWMRFP